MKVRKHSSSGEGDENIKLLIVSLELSFRENQNAFFSVIKHYYLYIVIIFCCRTNNQSELQDLLQVLLTSAVPHISHMPNFMLFRTVTLQRSWGIF